MKQFKILLTIALLFFTLGITSAQSTTKTKTTKHELVGKATYYGSGYHNGRRTASGEIFDKNKLTAAHKTLPFGTIVLVTNKSNGKTVTVRITDRGPFGKGRVIDLSVAAFKEIANLKTGVVDVTLQIIPPDPKEESTKKD